jgi:hypothetical protein
MLRIVSGVLCAGVVLAVALVQAPTAGAQPSPRVAALIEEHLYAGRLEDGEKALRALVAAEPGNADAQFALGGVLVVRAVERFGQSMYRHGLQTPRTAALLGLPLFSLPLSYNPRPEPLTYEGFRAIFARLVDDLDAAERELARVGDAPVKLQVDLARIRLDLDANGVADEREKLSAIIETLAQAARRRNISTPGVRGGETFPVSFDTADVFWLRGYANLLAVSAEFFLAHDFRTTFDATFHFFFPRAGLPFSRQLAEPTMPDRGGDMGSIFDAVAFIHLVRWDVAEPRRMASIHGRLKSVVDLNRKTWAAVRAETDDDNEWLPGPNQRGVLDMPVTEQMINSWLAMLDEFEAVLDGRRLVPHPRFVRGINLKRVLTEPRQFDLVLWITGHAVLPYLEDGPVADGRSWNQASQVFRGQLLAYAFWFN